jgi:hypothetical protein
MLFSARETPHKISIQTGLRCLGLVMTSVFGLRHVSAPVGLGMRTQVRVRVYISKENSFQPAPSNPMDNHVRCKTILGQKDYTIYTNSSR